MLPLSALDYTLPQELIAREPVSPRDSARLLVVSRSDPARLEHRVVRDLPELLAPGDLLIVNDSRVIPARLTGARSDTGGRVEGLFLSTTDGSERTWRIMLKAKRPRIGSRIDLTSNRGIDTGVSLELLARTTTEVHEADAHASLAQASPGATADDASHAADTAAWIVRVVGADDLTSAVAILDRVGSTPLPPYIRSARKRDATEAGAATHAAPTDDDAHDRTVYQTVYAGDKSGSVAAPTAGLHFTAELLSNLRHRGIARHPVTLHVGLGTFKPVETEFVEQHPIHAEWCSVPRSTAAALQTPPPRGGAGVGFDASAASNLPASSAPRARPRTIAVGTTAARTLESFTPAQLASTSPCEHWTRILITPGYAWQNVDGLMTNFHLPCTTLMAMVASLLDERSGAGSGDGVQRLQRIYAEAISHKYRFYSFGDAMLILP